MADGTVASASEDLNDIASEPDPWDTDEPNRARILWVKNLTRLRHQVSHCICLHFISNVIPTDSCHQCIQSWTG